MLRTYKWRGRFWRFEDGKVPEGAVLVEVQSPVTPEAPKRRCTTRKTKPKKK